MHLLHDQTLKKLFSSVLPHRFRKSSDKELLRRHCQCIDVPSDLTPFLSFWIFCNANSPLSIPCKTTFLISVSLGLYFYL